MPNLLLDALGRIPRLHVIHSPDNLIGDVRAVVTRRTHITLNRQKSVISTSSRPIFKRLPPSQSICVNPAHTIVTWASSITPASHRSCAFSENAPMMASSASLLETQIPGNMNQVVQQRLVTQIFQLPSADDREFMYEPLPMEWQQMLSILPTSLTPQGHSVFSSRLLYRDEMLTAFDWE